MSSKRERFLQSWRTVLDPGTQVLAHLDNGLYLEGVVERAPWVWQPPRPDETETFRLPVIDEPSLGHLTVGILVEGEVRYALKVGRVVLDLSGE